jgi:pyridoxine kinase
MGRVLALSSQVVRGHVGLSAIVPALQRLGHEVLAVPTILLSNHPGHPRAAGTRLEVNTLASIVEVLEANGWLSGLDAIITGYMPSVEHVGFAARSIDAVRRHSPDVLVLVDPVMGDDPRGLYIESATAVAMRDQLVTRAGLITPNRFELSWLAGMDVRGIDDVRPAADRLGVSVLATSVPASATTLANVLAGGAGDAHHTVVRHPKVPHGTGDLLTGLYVGHLLGICQGDARGALVQAVAGVDAAVGASLGRSDLDLSGQDWSIPSTQARSS